MTETIKTLLEPIQNRLNAATPGPWHWRNTSDVYLMGARTRVVMGFARMGMQGAQPQFVNEDGLFIDAGKENLHAIPDAAFIANAPTDQARLLAAIQAVDELIEEWRYKGEFGWGPWQMGEGPDFEGYILDNAAAEMRNKMLAALTEAR